MRTVSFRAGGAPWNGRWSSYLGQVPTKTLQNTSRIQIKDHKIPLPPKFITHNTYQNKAVNPPKKNNWCFQIQGTTPQAPSTLQIKTPWRYNHNVWRLQKQKPGKCWINSNAIQCTLEPVTTLEPFFFFARNNPSHSFSPSLQEMVIVIKQSTSFNALRSFSPKVLVLSCLERSPYFSQYFS